MVASARASSAGKYMRPRRGSDAGLLLRQPVPSDKNSGSDQQQQQQQTPPPNLLLASALATSRRRNCIRGGFPGPRASPSVLFSSQTLGVTVDGCAAFYSAMLSCAPEHAVTLVHVSTPPCLRITPSLLVFTSETWATPQYFRVAVLSSNYDDSNKDDRKLQVLEHACSSTDARFSGNRVLFLPCNVLVHVSGREGCYLFASGAAAGTVLQTSSPAATVAVGTTRHEFEQVELASAALSSRGGRSIATRNQSTVAVARASVQLNQPFSPPPSTANAEALANADALAMKRMSTRRGLLTAATTSSSLASSIQSSNRDGSFAHATPHDGVAVIKVVARAAHTAVLYKSGRYALLGTMAVDYTSEEHEQHERDTIGTNDSRGSNAALSCMLVDIDCGDAHVAALTEQGYVLTWGDGSCGRLGHGMHCSLRSPQAIRSLFHKRIVQVACGAQHTVVVADDGDVYAWGNGKCGALGHGRSEREQSFESVALPMEVLALKHCGVARVACGDAHTAVALASGALLTCGWGDHGRLGRAYTYEFSSYFARVTGGAMHGQLCTFVSCGGAHTLALTASNAVVAFGWNASGQLGIGDRRDRPLPVKLEYFDTDDLVVTAVAAGKLHSMALTQDARVFAWGSDELGQCGVGAFPQLYTVPHLVASCIGVNATQLSAGASHSVVLATASQKQLDAMQSNYPARYTALLENYALLVRSDAAQRAKVLAYAKHAQHRHELAARRRKPPTDPTLSLARTLELQCRLEHDLEATQLHPTRASRHLSLAARPRTAGALLMSRLNGSKDGHADAVAAEATEATVATTSSMRGRKIRCSSATLWRQTRLFTFDSTGRASTETGRPVATATSSRLNRPMSTSSTVSVQTARLGAEARQSLVRLLNGDSETRRPRRQQNEERRDDADSSTSGDSLGTASLLARLPVSRPTSAPSRAGAPK